MAKLVVPTPKVLSQGQIHIQRRGVELDIQAVADGQGAVDRGDGITPGTRVLVGPLVSVVWNVPLWALDRDIAAGAIAGGIRR